MELWWIGSTAEPDLLAVVLLVIFAAVVVLTRAAGFRRSADIRWSDVLLDSVEAVAIGLMCVTAVLGLLHEITIATPPREALGKVVYAAAPDEIPMLAAALEPPALLVLMAVSLVVSYAIVYVAGFGDQDKRHQQEGILQHPITETAVAYIVALGGAALMLLFFGGLDHAPAPWALSQVVVLGLPAAVGGAAGRIAI